MARITEKGRKLADTLSRDYDETDRLRELCSLICKDAVTYHRLQELSCNGHPAQGNPNIPVQTAAKLQEKLDRYIEAREGEIEKRVTRRAREIDPGIVPVFEGDPRGACILLKLPSGRTDDWGQRGICVPIR